MNRRTADGRLAGKYSASPFKVCIPLVSSRMKKSHNFAGFRICPRYIRAFVPIAVQAGKGKILKNG